MNRRAAVAPIVAGALGLVAVVGGSAPAARPDLQTGTLDLLASAHPSSAQPTVSDTAYAVTRARGPLVAADTAALTSSTCDGCVGESTALDVVYAPRTRRAALDNVATAWGQQCQGCTSTALSVQVVVLGGRPVVVPNNRALSLNAACVGCRTSALAYQVVLVTDHAVPLDVGELAGLQAWFDEQVAALRASVQTTEPTPSPSPTPTPETPTPIDGILPSPSPTTSARAAARAAKQARRDAVSALDELEALLGDAFDAETVTADVELGS